MSYVTGISGNVISAASAGYAPTNSADVSAIASAYATGGGASYTSPSGTIIVSADTIEGTDSGVGVTNLTSYQKGGYFGTTYGTTASGSSNYPTIFNLSGSAGTLSLSVSSNGVYYTSISVEQLNGPVVIPSGSWKISKNHYAPMYWTAEYYYSGTANIQLAHKSDVAVTSITRGLIYDYSTTPTTTSTAVSAINGEHIQARNALSASTSQYAICSVDGKPLSAMITATPYSKNGTIHTTGLLVEGSDSAFMPSPYVESGVVTAVPNDGDSSISAQHWGYSLITDTSDKISRIDISGGNNYGTVNLVMQNGLGDGILSTSFYLSPYNTSTYEIKAPFDVGYIHFSVSSQNSASAISSVAFTAYSQDSGTVVPLAHASALPTYGYDGTAITSIDGSAIGGGGGGSYVETSAQVVDIGSGNTSYPSNNGVFIQGIENENNGSNHIFAQGKGNYIEGMDCLAQGDYNRCEDSYSMAQGWYNTAKRSLSQGTNNYAELYSFAQGNQASATGYSFAQGQEASATSVSFAQGYDVTAGDISFVQGFKASAYATAAVFGKYNKDGNGAGTSGIALAFGDGTSRAGAHNLFEFRKNGTLTIYSSTADTDGLEIVSSIRAISAAATGGGGTADPFPYVIQSGTNQRAVLLTAFQDNNANRPTFMVSGYKSSNGKWPRMMVTDYNGSTGYTHSGVLLANAYETYIGTAIAGESGVKTFRMDEYSMDFLPFRVWNTSTQSWDTTDLERGYYHTAKYSRLGVTLSALENSGENALYNQFLNSGIFMSSTDYAYLDTAFTASGMSATATASAEMNIDSINRWNAKLDTSAIECDTASAITAIGGSSVGGGVDSATVSAIASSYVESGVSSKQDTLSFAYNTADQISSINGSALGGMDEAAVSGIASAYAESAVSSVSGNYYTTANESGFLTAQVQASWSESASASPSYIQDKPDLVDIVAGPGIVVDNPDGNTLRVSTDENYEAELYKNSGVPNSNTNDVFTLAEPVTNFERIRVEFWNREFNQYRITLEYYITDSTTSTVFVADMDHSTSTTNIQRVNMFFRYNSDGNIVDGGHNLFYGNGGSHTNGNNRGLGIHRIVGIHRIANN